MSETDIDSVPQCDGVEQATDAPRDRIKNLQHLVSSDEAVEQKQEIFKELANEKRIRILEALKDGEKCVCELQEALDAPQSTVATHLRRLRDAGLVTSRKEGTWRFYRVTDTGAFDLLRIAESMGER